MSRQHALSLQAHRYADIEQSMCTGDIVLFNDARATRPLERCAEWLAHFYALLPCTTAAIVCNHGGSGGSDDEGREWHHWRCAALVVRMIDETETNPHHDSNKQIPYVFYTRGDAQCQNLWPLKTLLADVCARADGAYFALRQLLTPSDTRHRRLSSQLRVSLRSQILSFYQETLLDAMAEQKSAGGATFEKRWRTLHTAIEQRTLPPPTELQAGAQQRQRHALYRASSCYFTLYTLFRINVLRCEPRASTAAEALQEGGCVEQQLHGDYFLGDELVFQYK